MVHKMLIHALQSDKHNITDNNTLVDICENMNAKHRASKTIQLESTEFFSAAFFKANTQLHLQEAIVSQLKSNALIVFVPAFHLKGTIFMQSKTGEAILPENVDSKNATISFNEKSLEMTVNTASAGSFNFKPFDHVQVKIVIEEHRAHRPQIKLQLVSLSKVKKQANQSATNVSQVQQPASASQVKKVYAEAYKKRKQEANAAEEALTKVDPDNEFSQHTDSMYSSMIHIVTSSDRPKESIVNLEIAMQTLTIDRPRKVYTKEQLLEKEAKLVKYLAKHKTNVGKYEQMLLLVRKKLGELSATA